jgi:hypothetical protein
LAIDVLLKDGAKDWGGSVKSGVRQLKRYANESEEKKKKENRKPANRKIQISDKRATKGRTVSWGGWKEAD